MANVSELPDLAKLPTQISLLAKAVPQAGFALIGASLGRLADPIPAFRSLLSLNEARLGWRLYLARAGSHVVFFFFRRDSPVNVVLDTNITFRVAAISRTRNPEIPVAEKIGRRIVLPPFIKVRPSPLELAKFGPPGATQKNTLMLLLGPQGLNVLAVKNPDEGRNAKLRYSLQGVRGPVVPQNGKWPLAPFLDLTATIRSWVQKGFEIGIESPFDENKLGDNSDVRQILRCVIQTYSESLRQVQQEHLNLDPLLSRLKAEYDVLDFQARIVLRLRDDGTLASDNEHDPFQLLMTIRMVPEQESIRARIAVGPPDFLVSGPIYDAFLDALREQAALAEIARQLRISLAKAADILHTFAVFGSIFRIKREDSADTDILCLPIAPGPIMLRGKFVVQAEKAPPQVKLVGGSLKNLLAPELGRAETLIDFDAVQYFLRLLNNLKRWIRVLQ